MDERPDACSDTYDTHIGRVRPTMEGRALALPPVAPLIGALGLLFGVVLGFGLAPTAAPALTPGPTDIAAVSPSPSAVPSAHPGRGVAAAATYELPPTDGLSLAKALEALNFIQIAPSPSEVVSARVARWTEVWSSPAAPPDVWVWAITLRSASPFWCSGERALESAGPSTSPRPFSCSGPTTEMFVLDYHTGDFLEAMSPARP